MRDDGIILGCTRYASFGCKKNFKKIPDDFNGWAVDWSSSTNHTKGPFCPRFSRKAGNQSWFVKAIEENAMHS